MDWTSALGGILQKYAGGGGGTAPVPEDAHDDFQQVAGTAPRDLTTAGVEQAFRSDRTPPFGQMVSQLFTHADDSQRATLLNRLLGSVGPGGLGAVPGVSTVRALVGGAQEVAPQQARQIPPAEVEQLAAHAERQNSGAVTQISDFVSQHPDMIKALGGLAAAIAIQHIARRS